MPHVEVFLFLRMVSKMKQIKIEIVHYAQSVLDPNILIAYTANGGRLELHWCDVPTDRCLTKGKLYLTSNGLFFSLTKRFGLRQISVDFALCHRTPGMHCHNGVRGCDYPQMRSYGNKYCHVLMCTVFYGQRPVVDGVTYQCDHLNGDVMDWSKDNLEWVSPKENARRAWILRRMRRAGIDPRSMSREELQEAFSV